MIRVGRIRPWVEHFLGSNSFQGIDHGRGQGPAQRRGLEQTSGNIKYILDNVEGEIKSRFSSPKISKTSVLI